MPERNTQGLSPEDNEFAKDLYSNKHKSYGKRVLGAIDLVNDITAARAIVEDANENGARDQIPYETGFAAAAEYTRRITLSEAKTDEDANLWRAHQHKEAHFDEYIAQARSEALADGISINDGSDTAKSIEGQDAHEVLEGIEKGERVRFQLGFNKERLAQIDPSDFMSPRDRERDTKIDRLTSMLDTYGRLPDTLSFEPGVTAIFGENGSGKTVLADALIMSIQMQQYRQENNLPKGPVPLMNNFEPGFNARLLGRLTNSADSDDRAVKMHTQLVFSIANAIDVDGAVLHDPKADVGAALRTPAALGNTTMGMSSRQAVDMLDAKSGSFAGESPSIKLYDEPELGMSPARQLRLAEELKARVADGSAEIVPTNSVILFQDASIPRIDLGEPEKGVHYTTKSEQ